MELIRQPQDGVRPLLTAVASASKSIDIVIFRLDIKALVSALRDAVNRGVVVRALVAHVSKGSTGSLRRLEQTLLDIGVTVARTADDLVRYHGKMMVIDGRRLHVYGFNYTSADIRGSRSFGFVLTDRALVREALALFDADCERRAYQPGHRHFVVSPFNARPVLARFVRAARRQLLIYDPSVTDPEIVRIVVERQWKGVDVRIIGGASRKGPLTAERCPNHRLHVRAIMRDGTHAFVGSQSLRTLELDKRREIGIIVSSKPVVNEMMAVFESDWTSTPTGRAAKATSEAAIEALTATEEAKDALARHWSRQRS